MFINHALINALRAGVPTFLSTDSDGVMITHLPNEKRRGGLLLGYCQNPAADLWVEKDAPASVEAPQPGTPWVHVRCGTLPPAQKALLAADTTVGPYNANARWTNTYLKYVCQGDIRDLRRAIRYQYTAGEGVERTQEGRWRKQTWCTRLKI
jgi:hypothetical protein